MGYSLLINGVNWGELTHLLTIDPNFQRDIQVPGLNCHNMFSKLRFHWKSSSIKKTNATLLMAKILHHLRCIKTLDKQFQDKLRSTTT